MQLFAETSPKPCGDNLGQHEHSRNREGNERDDQQQRRQVLILDGDWMRQRQAEDGLCDCESAQRKDVQSIERQALGGGTCRGGTREPREMSPRRFESLPDAMRHSEVPAGVSRIIGMHSLRHETLRIWDDGPARG
jgi:hypothetical protein